MTKDLDVSIEGHHVLVVEDIVDSGVTLTYLMNVLKQRRPKSLNIATLLDKPERRLRPVDVALRGFQNPRRIRSGVRTRLRGGLSEPGGCLSLAKTQIGAGD